MPEPGSISTETSDELRIIRERISNSDIAGVVELALATGMRRGELLGLRWADVSLERRELRGRTHSATQADDFTRTPPKTYRSHRVIELLAFGVALLGRQHRDQLERRMRNGRDLWIETDTVFDDGIEPVMPWHVSRTFSSKVREAGLRPLVFNSLLYHHATALLAAGRNPVEVSARLGHSSVVFTLSVYGHVMPGAGRALAETVDEILGGR